MAPFDEGKMLIEGRKVLARQMTTTAIRSGLLEREPCIHCGDPESAAHHSDYCLPLEVVWLCQSCHSRHHIRLRRYDLFIAKEKTKDTNEAEPLPLDDELNNLEKKRVREAMRNANENKTRAANLLGISLRSLRYRLDKHGISFPTPSRDVM